MPKLDDRKEAVLTREVRQQLALDPLITSRELQQKIEKSFNHSIDRDFLLKLVRKVNIEVQLEGDELQLRPRINQLRERTAAMIQRLTKIAFWQWEYLSEGIDMPTNSEVIMAMQTIMKMDCVLLEAEMNSGIFKRREGAEDEWRRRPVDPAVKAQIIGALRAWKVLPTSTDGATDQDHKLERGAA